MLQLADVVDHFPLPHRPRPGGVVADHATQVRPAAGRDIGAELQTERCQGRIQRVEHDSRLDAHQSPLDVENAVHEFAEVDDQGAYFAIASTTLSGSGSLMGCTK